MGILSARPEPTATAEDPLARLLAPIESLPGLRKPELLARAAGGGRVLDLLLHLPERVQHRPVLRGLAGATEGQEVTLELRITGAPARGGRGPWTVPAVCGTDPVALISFSRATWAGTALGRAFPQGAERRVAGRLKPYQRAWQLELDADPLVEPPLRIPLWQPMWPLTAGLSWRNMADALDGALKSLPDLPEWVDGPLLKREAWPGFAEALRALHAPQAQAAEAPRRRLGYDELLAGQIALGLVRRRSRERPGRALMGNESLRSPALAAFGHAPTPSQLQAMAEIDADLAAPRRMLRLLQGDVGAGKTLVALMAMLRAVEAGAQAALMAPTELLARQHLRSFERLCGAAGVPVALLAGSVKGKERRRVLQGLADGTLPIVVGTHALFQEGVAFKDLGLAVVDEQHRFGVAQRLMLAEKGQAADMLVMTATPIPRTLLLTQWGEMAVSRMAGKPAGRQPIATRILSQERLPEIVARLHEAVARGARAYWVVRAITGSEKDDSVAAEDRFAELSGHFPGRVGLAHGMQDVAVREAALGDFAAGRTNILVATTVIEVGVDVPEATIMLIEQAERFGLAALHQLRGRVGRGKEASSCLLVHSPGLSDGERRRLLVLRDTEDGFVIAEEDLKSRGGGDALGARQAGLPGARLFDAREDPDQFARYVQIAHRDAEALLTRDAALASPRGQAARLLLRLFGHDLSMAPLDAG